MVRANGTESGSWRGHQTTELQNRSRQGGGRGRGGNGLQCVLQAPATAPLRSAICQHAPRLVVANGLGVCGLGVVAGMGRRAAGGHDQPVPVPYNELLPVCNPRVHLPSAWLGKAGGGGAARE